MEKRVCVTGAGGFIASWLVKLLLSKGYTVHGTVRDPSDGKNAHLKNVDKASGNLQLFKADLLDYNAFAGAIAGCEGVFHAASPVPSTKMPNPEVEVIIPAVTGTLNILKACSEAKVKRVVMVSSSAAVGMIPNWPKDKVMDEDSWSDNEYCRTTENWYSLSKTLAEKEALAYADQHGLDVVTVCPSLVFGPLIQSTVNLSSLFLVNILKGWKRKRWKKVTVMKSDENEDGKGKSVVLDDGNFTVHDKEEEGTSAAGLVSPNSDLFHEVWGQLMKTGYQNSCFAHQVERFACFYTSKVTNISLYSPEKYYRPSEDFMPHEFDILAS